MVLTLVGEREGQSRAGIAGRGSLWGKKEGVAEGRRTGPIPALLMAARARKGDSQHP